MGFAGLDAVYTKQARQDNFMQGKKEPQDAQYVLTTATKVIQVCRGKPLLLETAPAQLVPTFPLLSPRFALSQ